MLTPLHSIQESQYTLLGQVHLLGGLRVGTWMAHLSRPPEEAMHKVTQPLLHATVVRNMIQHIQGQAGLRATLGRSGRPPMPLLCMGEQVMKGMCPEEGQEGVPPLSSGPPHPESSPIVLHLMAQAILEVNLVSGRAAIHQRPEAGQATAVVLLRICILPNSRWAVAGCMHPKVAMVDEPLKAVSWLPHNCSREACVGCMQPVHIAFIEGSFKPACAFWQNLLTQHWCTLPGQ